MTTITCQEANDFFEIDINENMSSQEVLNAIPDDCFYASLCPQDILEALEENCFTPIEVNFYRIMPQSVFAAWLV